MIETFFMCSRRFPWVARLQPRLSRYSPDVSEQALPWHFASSVAVVTGGASGIGAALVARLAADGARVAVLDVDEARAVTAAAERPGAIGIGCDVGDPMEVAAAVDRVEAELGPIDLYCSNAGIPGSLGLGDDAGWAAGWAVHGMAHVYAARAVLPGMRERRRGAMVITASAAGLLAMMQSATYSVTKHASVAIAEWLAIEYGGDGVSVHCLAPQGVLTPMLTDDPVAQAEAGAAGELIKASAVAEAVLAAVHSGTFLVLPHAEVHDFEVGKVADRDRWIAGMRRYRDRSVRLV